MNDSNGQTAKDPSKGHTSEEYASMLTARIIAVLLETRSDHALIAFITGEKLRAYSWSDAVKGMTSGNQRIIDRDKQQRKSK